MKKNSTPPLSPRPRLFTLLAAAIALALLPIAQAQTPAPSPPPIQTATTLDRTQTHIGEHITATIKIQWPPETTHLPPLALPPQVGTFEILNTEQTQDKKNEDGLLERTLTLTITTFELGPQTFGPIEIPYTAAPDTTQLQTHHTQAQTIETLSILPEANATTPATIRPIKPPLEIPHNLKHILLLTGIALLLLTLTALAIRHFRKRGKILAPLPPPPPLLPPHEEALRALAQIETSGTIERDTAKSLYTQLSHILRRYLGRRHRIDALEMTSTELLQSLRQIGWDQQISQYLRQDLQEADAVKFAKYAPPQPKRHDALNRIRHIINTTTPETQPTTPEPLPINQEGTA